MSAPDTSPRAEQARPAILSGRAEAEYVARLRRILRSARLNLHYPEARALSSHVALMAPKIHRGLYPGLQIHQESGLPSYREWTRVKTDVDIAHEQLIKLGDRSELEKQAQQNDAEIYQKLLKKYDYYAQIKDRQLAALGDMSVALRRIDEANRTAYFRIVLDKLDASGIFVRYSIKLAQTHGAWNKKVVELDAETARHTDQFKSLIYKFTALPSDLTFVKLAALGGVRVERVVRGTVGPIFWRAEQATPELRPLFEASGAEGFIAQFGLDMLADDIAEDRHNDPLQPPGGARVSPEVKAALERAREKFGVRIFRDRKFVVPRAMLPALREFCQARGTNNMIYGV